MTAAPLAGLRVVVTRPAHQAQGLSQAITAAGGEALLFPGLEIAPPQDLARAQAQLARLADHDWLIFISANAVQAAWRQADAVLRAYGGRIAAVGAATAAALANLGVGVDLQPEADFSSEGLLATPVLRAVQGRRVLIIRGEGGREHLAQTLRARGAHVEYAEVYRRRCPVPSAELIEAVWVRRAPAVVIATSPQILDNLDRILTLEAARRAWLAAQWVVVSQTMVARAQALGCARPALLARPDDRALLAALLAWHTR
jgi:uroporphyrinogen-III synthase